VVLAGRHRPHELLLLVVSVLTGTAYTVGAPPPGSLTALLPGWAVLVWSVGMVASGALGLAGAWRSLRVEAAGMLIGSAALIWYSAAVAPIGWRASFACAISTAWAAANLWRAVQIHRDLRVPSE
jgi:hypothetical protein